MIPIAIYLLFVPWFVMHMAQRWRWIDKVSPMTVLYVVGLVVGNIGIVGDKSLATCELFSSLAVPLAIPLMLMGCTLHRWSVGKSLKAFLSGLVAVMVVTVVGFYIFKGQGTLGYDSYAQICAVATGMYTGGIPNVGAIAQGVGLSKELYLIVTSSDLIATGLYLIFVIFVGRQLFRKLLPKKGKISVEKERDEYAREGNVIENAAVKVRPFDKEHWKGSLLVIGIAVLIAAISYGVALLPSGDGKPHMTLLILLLTTLSIAVSFVRPVQRQQQSFDLGLYCVYVFCLSIATMVNVSELHLSQNIGVIYYLAFAIFGSLVLQILLARLLRLDGDSVLVTSVALINSPPFVPMVAALLNNKDVVILGITVGLLGYMLGNYLGIGIYNLLMALG